MTEKKPLTASLSALSPARKRLVRMMLDLHFGKIADLHIRHGQPCFKPPPRVVRDVVFGKNNEAHPCLEKHDFALKRQVLELFEQLDDLGDGIIASLFVQNGLPVRMKIEKPFRA